MSLRVTLRPRAARDLERNVEYLDENAGREIGDRYVVAASKTFERLGKHPYLGVSRPHPNPIIDGLRIIPVSGFENYVIHYIVREHSVEIVRILHAAQDSETILHIEDE